MAIVIILIVCGAIVCASALVSIFVFDDLFGLIAMAGGVFLIAVGFSLFPTPDEANDSVRVNGQEVCQQIPGAVWNSDLNACIRNNKVVFSK